jgi:hypothetical protein
VPDLLVNATNQPVEVHLGPSTVVVLEARGRVEIELGEGPHPLLDELVRRRIVSLIAVEPSRDRVPEPPQSAEPPESAERADRAEAADDADLDDLYEELEGA